MAAAARVAVPRRRHVPAPPAAAPGSACVGMRERAHALGGTVEAGPGGSGWLVHAELPLLTGTAAP